jgi:RHS repeat-associated protein
MGCLKLPYQDRQERVAEATLKILGSPKGKRVKPENCYNYYPFGLTFNSYQRSYSKANKYQYQDKEILDDLNLNIYDFHARGYDPVIGRTWQQDPMSDKYYSWSPYSWVMNNPLKYMDPTGMFSTHTDKDGNVVAVYNDGDLGVYQHEGQVNKNDIDAKYSADNKSAGGTKMGETLTWSSFADPKDGNNAGKGLGKINFGSFEARDWLNSVEPSGLIDYVTNAGTGADQKYDYKSQGLSPTASGSEIEQYRYRGSQISPGVYASARDVGNIFAGMYGSLFGTHKDPMLKAMGAFNANRNQLNKGLVKQLFQNWSEPYGEDYRSHYMQSVGYDMGKSNNEFRKKFGVN